MLREDDEVRVAIVGRSGVDRAWRLHSSTPLGEVQLAEPYADGVVVVVRSYTDDRSEFTVARLGSREKELVVVPGAGHLFEEPGALDAVARHAANWFARHLPTPDART